MSARVLVAYASKHGSTRALAQAVGGALHACGCHVRVLPAGLVHSLVGFDAVVLGSAIYHDQWLWEGRRCLKRVHAELTERPVWLFSSGPIGGTPESEELIACGCGPGAPLPPSLVPALHDIRMIDHAMFAGKVDETAGGLFERDVARGDWRDFRQVSDWGHAVGVRLRPPRPVRSGLPVVHVRGGLTVPAGHVDRRTGAWSPA